MSKKIISSSIHRRFVLGRQGLWPGRRWSGKEGAARALRQVEAVQIDPVSVVAQSHDIGLWLESWFRPDEAFAAALTKGLSRFMTFLTVKRVDSSGIRSDFLRKYLDKHLPT